MYSCSSALSQILFKNSFGKVVFQILVTCLFCETKIRFLAALLKQNIFWSFFLLIYGCFGCIHILCTFCTEISTEKYSKLNGSKWTPLCTNGSEKYLMHLSVKKEIHDTVTYGTRLRWGCSENTTSKENASTKAAEKFSIVLFKCYP